MLRKIILDIKIIELSNIDLYKFIDELEKIQKK
jgi:hypothetical protein